MSKAEDRRIAANLKRHTELTAQYVAEGMTQDAASKRAFNEVTGVRTNLTVHAVAAAIAAATDVAIPMFSVMLRHPVYGWQVVAVGTSNACDKAFKQYKKQTQGTCSMDIREISGNQMWSIKRSYNGKTRLTHG